MYKTVPKCPKMYQTKQYSHQMMPQSVSNDVKQTLTFEDILKCMNTQNCPWMHWNMWIVSNPCKTHQITGNTHRAFQSTLKSTKTNGEKYQNALMEPIIQKCVKHSNTYQNILERTKNYQNAWVIPKCATI